MVVNDGGEASGGVWGDYDNDGFIDLLVINWSQPHHDFLYHNLGDGSFERVQNVDLDRLENSRGGGGGWADYDNDGFLDIFIANAGGPGANFLLRNPGDGTGRFARVLQGPLVEDEFASLTGAWADYDGDGWMDLFVPNTWDATIGTDNNLYRNLGDGTFTRIQGSAVGMDGGGSQSAAWGDYDNDGDLDLYVTNGRQEPNFFYRNDGAAGFTKITTSALTGFGDPSIGTAWGDYDNDGDLDLYVCNSWNTMPSYLFRNDGAGDFTRITSEAGSPVTDLGEAIGVAWGDYDNDGDLDLFVAKSDRNNALYRNDGNDNHWLLVHCEGSSSNRSAIGAKVRARATINGQPVWQLREISGSSAYGGQNDPRAHFGLGDADTVDTLRIEWPSGAVQELRDVAADQILAITEPPSLTIQQAVILAWPMVAEEFVLESASALGGPWTPVEAEPTTADGQTTVTVVTTGTSQFFRLREP